MVLGENVIFSLSLNTYAGSYTPVVYTSLLSDPEKSGGDGCQVMSFSRDCLQLHLHKIEKYPSETTKIYES